MPKRKQRAARKPARIAKRKKTRVGPSRPLPTLSECATHYALASIDPFGTVAGACVPDHKTAPSIKFKWVERGTCLCGTTFGFVAAATAAPTASLKYGNYSGTSFANGGTDGWADADTGVSEPTFPATLPNSFTPADSAVGPQWRLVAMGLRVRYMGPEDTLGGQYYLHSSSNNNTMYNDTITFNQIVSSQQTRVEPVDRNWHTISWTPKQQADFDYSESAYYPANSSVMEPIAICFQSTADNMFAWEMVWHWEIQTYTSTAATASHSDPVGLAAVNDARSKFAAANARPTTRGFLSSVIGSLATSFSSSVPLLAGSAANSFIPGSGTAVSAITRSMMEMMH